MKSEAIRELYRTSPFRSFTIRTASGESFKVEHPELLSIGRADDIIVVHNPEGGFNVIDTASITEVIVPKRRTKNASSD